MSLHLIQTTVPIVYELCQPGDGSIYNAFLCTPPRIYVEQFIHTAGAAFLNFWYDQNKDRYILTAQVDYARWPSWRVNKYELHPETGLVTEQALGIPSGIITFTDTFQNGDFNKVYALARTGDRRIAEVNPDTLALSLTPVVLPADVGLPFFTQYVLNRRESIVGVTNNFSLEVHNYATSTKLSTIAIPMADFSDIAYEDNARAWGIGVSQDSTTTVMKFDYTVNAQVLGVTALQPSVLSDLNSRVAYDSKRKVLAIFRQHVEAVDGAATHELSFFKPFMVSTGLTDPVPVTPLTPGNTTTFVAHLLGDRGEAGQLKKVTISNSGDGTVLQTSVSPRSNGSIVFQYLAGPDPGTDTITLSVDI